MFTVLHQHEGEEEPKFNLARGVDISKLWF